MRKRQFKRSAQTFYAPFYAPAHKKAHKRSINPESFISVYGHSDMLPQRYYSIQLLHLANRPEPAVKKEESQALVIGV